MKLLLLLIVLFLIGLILCNEKSTCQNSQQKTEISSVTLNSNSIPKVANSVNFETVNDHDPLLDDEYDGEEVDEDTDEGKKVLSA